MFTLIVGTFCLGTVGVVLLLVVFVLFSTMVLILFGLVFILVEVGVVTFLYVVLSVSRLKVLSDLLGVVERSE